MRHHPVPGVGDAREFGEQPQPATTPVWIRSLEVHGPNLPARSAIVNSHLLFAAWDTRSVLVSGIRTSEIVTDRLLTVIEPVAAGVSVTKGSSHR